MQAYRFYQLSIGKKFMFYLHTIFIFQNESILLKIHRTDDVHVVYRDIDRENEREREWVSKWICTHSFYEEEKNQEGENVYEESWNAMEFISTQTRKSNKILNDM